MKNTWQRTLILGAIAIMSITAGLRVHAYPTSVSSAPAYHQAIADSDIGDGTSPTKKG
ncbi:MAG TPA: hypothetical protein VGM37_07905 [Armatimonadota bacterium]|jgi:hypothetical protein